MATPPLHAAGVSRDHRALWALVEGAPKRLTPAGTLWLVTQRGVALDEPLRERFGKVRVAASNKGFKVWQAERPRGR